MGHYFKIYEDDFWHREYEDFKNDLYLMVLNDDIEKWIEENLIGKYDINCDDQCNSDCGYIFIEFTNDMDAMAFKLRWL